MSNKNIQKYKIITLNPQIILEHFVIVEKNNKCELEYNLDFSKGSISQNQAIMLTDEYSENPMFAQMRHCLEEKNGQAQKADKKQLLERAIFFLDFEEMFSKNADLKKPYDFSKKEWKKEELLGDGINDKMYFLFKNGFNLTYEDCKVHYVPFDGSASMSRACRISFIDETLKGVMDERLCLGMDLSKIQVKPHKYFAYRGLYLTDCERVDEIANLTLDENTVVVIDDSTHYYLSGKTPGKVVVPVITAKEREDSYWNVQKKESNPKINAFDGEGFISKKFSEMINTKCKKNGATSYQVRMPFIKGMLHTVDYHEFFKEYGNLKENEPYLIEDVYGVTRDLKKANIVLTKSMFKCFDWVKDYATQNKIDDPMAFFFDGMKKYDHGLYIAKTNLSLSMQKVKINYQYLCTLNLTKDEFKSLVRDHISYIEEIKNNPNLQREILLGARPKKEEATWKVALSKNKDFLREPFVRDKIKWLIDSYYKEIYMGQLRVDGENRFLSGDLLALLVDMLIKHNQLVDDAAVKNNIDLLKKQGIRKVKFLLPKPCIKLCSKKEYAFLRNPHLSRNEECAMKPYIAKTDSVHRKYFGELSGVVMVSYQSLAPMVLGGADFDGDMVKVISNRTIVKAVERGKEKCGEIVVIPSASEGLVYTPKQVEYKHVKDMYGNRVGQISNIAIRLGTKVYSSDEYEAAFDETGKRVHASPAECTLLTGLEIDAAKNGKHPDKNIDELAAKFKGKSDDYISILDKMKTYYKMAEKYPSKNKMQKKLTRESIEKSGKKYDLIFSIWDTTEKISVKNSGEENVANIECLPGMYLEALFTQDKNKKNVKKTPATNLFSFPSKEENADIEAIYKAYSTLAERYSYIKMLMKASEKRKWLGRAINILKKQYDTIYAIDNETGNSVMNTYSHIYEVVENAYEDDNKLCRNEMEQSIERLEKLQWICTQKDERKDVLLQILPKRLSKLAEDETAVDILTNFEESGYYLLYYLLKDLEDMKVTALQKEEEVPYKHRVELEGTSEESTAYKKAYDYLHVTFLEAIRSNMEVYVAKQELLGSVKKYIAEELKLEYASVAGTVYKMSPGFFWKMFSVNGKEIDITELVVCDKEYRKWKQNRGYEDAFSGPENEEDLNFC